MPVIGATKPILILSTFESQTFFGTRPGLSAAVAVTAVPNNAVAATAAMITFFLNTFPPSLTVDVYRSPKHRSITLSNRNSKVKGLTNKTR